MTRKLLIKKFFNVLLLAATFALTFAACSNIASVTEDSGQNSNQTKTLSGRIIADGELFSNSRTAFPSIPDDLTYEVTAKLKTSASTTSTGTVNTTTNRYSIPLTDGEWYVTINAKSGETIFLSKTEEINFPDDSSKDFVLEYYTTTATTGSVALPITFEDTLPISYISVQIDNAAAPTAFSIFDNSDGVKKLTYTHTALTPLSAGPHTFRISFLNDTMRTLYSFVQKVNIYPDLTTNKFDGPESYIDSATGAIKITAAHLAEAELTTFYVNSDYTSYGGKGTYFDPVKTLKKAVDLVNNSTATPADGFKIIVLSATTTEDQHITLNTGKTLTIQSSLAGTSRTITGVTMSGSTLSSFTTNGTVNFTDIELYNLKLNVASGSVTMTDSALKNNFFASTISYENGGLLEVASGAEFEGEDLTINAGKASDKGGAIYSEGTVTLTGCTLTSSSAKNGGAIYSTGSLTLTNCTISKNKANKASGAGGEGGAIYASGVEGSISTVELTNCIIGVETPTILPTASNCTTKGGNYSEGGGGAIMLDDHSSLTATGSKINGNYAGGAGGAINTDTGSHISVQITDGEIRYNNTATNGGGLQIYSIKDKNSFIKNTKIQNNNATQNGGGISVPSGKYFKIDSCTDISDNTASGSGDGCYAAGNLILTGSSYVADGIYLNTNPLYLANDFALSGTSEIPLSYSDSSFTIGDALLKGSDTSTSVTAAQCTYFELEDDTLCIQHNTATPNTGILALASSGGTSFTVGSSDCDFSTLGEALTAVESAYASTPGVYELKICSNLTIPADLEIKTPGIKITSDLATPPTITSTNYMITVNPGSGEDVEIEKINFSGLKGGINVTSGQLTINNSTVMNGSTYNSDYAAGITIKSGATLKSDEGLVIDSCDNNIDGGHSGIFNNGGNIELTGTIIQNCDNTNAGSGGGIFTKKGLWDSTSNTMKLENCIITNNTAGTGGGIYCCGTEITIEGGEISSNTATYGSGGGVYLSNSGSDAGKFIMQDSALIIKDNKVTAGTYGGGIYIETGEAKLILNSTSKDTNNNSSSGKLCYICDGAKILAGSTINGNPWSADTVLSSSHIAN
ncbi:MAG: hypothetical protein IKQ13_06125 [Treponema sp.]|nr:hypothetical protein [Treponema sp.]